MKKFLLPLLFVGLVASCAPTTNPSTEPSIDPSEDGTSESIESIDPTETTSPSETTSDESTSVGGNYDITIEVPDDLGVDVVNLADAKKLDSNEFLYAFASIGFLYVGYNAPNIKTSALLGAFASTPVMYLALDGVFREIPPTEQGRITMIIAILIVGMLVAVIGAWAKRSRVKAKEEYEKKFRAEKQALLNREKRIFERLQFDLKGEDFKSTEVNISYRKSKGVEITNDVDFELFAIDHTEYIKPFKIEADKTAIKEALAKGITIPGCELVEKQNMQIK